MSTVLLVVSHLVAAVAGAVAWPHLTTLLAAWKSSRAVADAKALIAKVEADAKALEAAKATVAAAPVAVVSAPAAPAPSGTTGPHA